MQCNVERLIFSLVAITTQARWSSRTSRHICIL